MQNSAEDIIAFWFDELSPKQWWQKSAALDSRIKASFSHYLTAGALGELFTWRNSPRGRLAEIIVLDQFSRNIYRNTAQAFAQDPLALALAQECVASQADLQLPPEQRAFVYMPYMHSESLLIHREAIRLFTELGNPPSLEFQQRHMEIIQRFGRYPHRNALLGRASSAEEEEFLKQPNAGF